MHELKISKTLDHFVSLVCMGLFAAW